MSFKEGVKSGEVNSISILRPVNALRPPLEVILIGDEHNRSAEIPIREDIRGWVTLGFDDRHTGGSGVQRNLGKGRQGGLAVTEPVIRQEQVRIIPAGPQVFPNPRRR